MFEALNLLSDRLTRVPKWLAASLMPIRRSAKPQIRWPVTCINSMVANQYRRADGTGRAEHFWFLLSGAVAAETGSVFRTNSVDIIAANADRRKTQQAMQLNGRFCSRQEVCFHFVACQPQDLNAPALSRRCHWT